MKNAARLVLLLVIATGLQLSAHQLTLKVGLFQPQLNSDLWDINRENLAFDTADMLEGTFAAEYEYFLDQRLSLAFETSTYSKTHYSQYSDWVHEDGSPIFQNLALRITSFELAIKLYPFGHRPVLHPFLGLGGGLYAWRYEQWGEFIDFNDMSVSDGYAETETYTLGASGRAGFGFQFNPLFGLMVEAKYQYLKGRLSSFFEGFESLDLSGFTYQLGLTFRFR